MNSTVAQPFDSKFEELLREAAAAPRSMLLRVERPQVFPALRSREAPVSVAMAGLSSVERELLASYRCELGFLLRQAAQTALMSDSMTGRWIDPTIAENRVHNLPSKEDWALRASICLSSPPTSPTEEVSIAAELLPRLIAAADPRVTTQQIAAASLRVESTDQARIYAGVQLAAEGAWRLGVEVLRQVLDGNSSVENQAFALEASALAMGRAGRLDEAVDRIRCATYLGFPRAELPMRYVFYSALAGDPAALEDASFCVSRDVPNGHPSVTRFCDDMASKMRQGAWKLAPEARDTLRRFRVITDSVTARILHEITSQPQS